MFTLNKDGSGFRVLHSFAGSGGDGQHPFAGLIEGSDGALYGTTVGGGSNGVGTAFTLNKDGSRYGVLHNFHTNGFDGANPFAGLVEGSDGALYGTTRDGGSNGVGTVFTLNRDGSRYGVLLSFRPDGFDGQNPSAGLVEGSDGALYGTTCNGGSNGVGTVFTLNRDGSCYGVLCSFRPDGSDGQNPSAGLLEGSDGILYGTTYNGGSNGVGTVFKLNKDGRAYTAVLSFGGLGGDGANSSAGLVEGSDGALYGTTVGGGRLPDLAPVQQDWWRRRVSNRRAGASIRRSALRHDPVWHQ